MKQQSFNFDQPAGQDRFVNESYTDEIDDAIDTLRDLTPDYDSLPEHTRKNMVKGMLIAKHKMSSERQEKQEGKGQKVKRVPPAPLGIDEIAHLIGEDELAKQLNVKRPKPVIGGITKVGPNTIVDYPQKVKYSVPENKVSPIPTIERLEKLVGDLTTQKLAVERKLIFAKQALALAMEKLEGFDFEEILELEVGFPAFKKELEQACMQPVEEQIAKLEEAKQRDEYHSKIKNLIYQVCRKHGWETPPVDLSTENLKTNLTKDLPIIPEHAENLKIIQEIAKRKAQKELDQKNAASICEAEDERILNNLENISKTWIKDNKVVSEAKAEEIKEKSIATQKEMLKAAEAKRGFIKYGNEDKCIKTFDKLDDKAFNILEYLADRLENKEIDDAKLIPLLKSFLPLFNKIANESTPVEENLIPDNTKYGKD